MTSYVISYTSMPIEADCPDEAIARDGNGGGNWTAVAVPEGLGVLPVVAYVDEGDNGLPVGHIEIGGVSVHCYQHTDDDGAIAVIEVDRADTYRTRVYVDDGPVFDTTTSV